MSNVQHSSEDIIRIGSRGSQLALWQANHVMEALRAAGYRAEIEIIRTTGDRMQQPGFVPPANLDGKGIFIKEIEEALEQGRIDLAVHSLKDLPTELAPQFTLAAIPRRADARDVWVCEQYWGLHTLPEGGRIGTTSPRRRAQLLALRPDVQFVEVRGNIDTRLRKLEEGQCDALVLAAAGLDRLGRTENVHYRFRPDELCPAPGQGALAIETLSASSARNLFIRDSVAFLDHAPTRFAVEAERVVLDALGGGCSLPIGVHCIPPCEDNGKWRMIAQVVAPDGEAVVTVEAEAAHATDPCALGDQVADELKSRGALDLLASTA
ncbi:porphobilinogen deaminase [Edaphobacter acidisoli]|uniref:Porphobilinogen deaminase n=1 Tax=Edaphobacter acidisoli TaxID=2040573 RepID=A0A916W0Z7_9BACT|nr:hydroxymethylbilane synthase [Edaphobacter acidisoli]GGA57609.1 porphobilinogen deaminase [Edaphobacter acidisoli]